MAAFIRPYIAMAADRVESAGKAANLVTTGQTVPELSAFDDTMRRFMIDRDISAGSLAVTREGKLMVAKGYANPQIEKGLTVAPTSLFRIASVSKPLTAMAMLRLVQDDVVKLSTPITGLLDLSTSEGQNRTPELDRVTIQNLLQHLGGWNRNTAFDPMFRDLAVSVELGIPLPITKYDVKTYMAARPLQHEPGSTYSYSNFGYSLLGHIIECVSGISYEAYVRRKVFVPLKIKRPVLGRTLKEHRFADEVTYRSEDKGQSVFDAGMNMVPSPYGAWNLENMDAHGGWLASAVDLVRFAAAFDTPEECPFLSAPMVVKAFALPENINRENYTLGDAYYGCGWSVRDWGDGKRNTWHNGSLPGTHTLLVRRWRGNLNWCALFNQRNDPSGLSYGDIDGLLHQAADSVEHWPDHDLFGEYSL
ncbi:MAG: serine hydrolase [Verrucomicrobia bacterium]|nr:serine hydrolase [Verrucomicrobiota bacterium]